MRYLTSTFLFLIYSALAAQSAPSIEWQKALGGTHGESANAVQQTSDGGYIVAGNSMSNDGDVTGNHGGGDYWIVKLNPAGGIQWQKTLGGSNVDDAQSIRQTTDGGYIIAGSSNSGDGDISGNHGNYDYWIVKLDSNGNMQWQKSLGGSSMDMAQSIQQTSEGGYIVAGSSSSNDGDVSGNHGGGDYWIVKLDINGNIQWQKSLGGSSSEQVNSVQQTFDGGYIIAGTTVSTDGDITVSYGNNDFWVVKLDSGGNMQWQKTLGNIGDNIGYYAQQTFDGGYIAVGTSFNSSNLESGLPDYWVIKLSNNGTIEWDKYFGGSFHDNAITIRQTPEWDYIVAGWTASNNGQVTNHHGNLDYWIIKLDSSGNLKWEKTLGGPDFDYLTALELTADNGYIVSGSTGSTSGDVTGHHGMIDAWIVKLSPEQLGIPENQQRHKPNLYPNPAKEFFYLDHLPRESTISITDMSGRKLFSQKYNEEKIKISTSAFMEGLYMVQVKNREEIILTKKITIIR
ncbi:MULTISPECIES: T9SS type A sorting domain-containing protein [Chryseobacterium]|uniref:T9SS C-terminal target domain-containing protein n=1 Tax=Chryseobacterium cucumeris TaxID=1813611 RepID=A0ABX9X645_9FLAO|nr:MULTISPECIES: T9SS type A sorting domain-containing protein [Chryseobacterium]ROH89845.1 T9SS C-terminal target domain-containing protein [Chryseobacterium cucumeris]WFB65589.1 T9SS type A sorting domain-containing protein [Chryseobacterium sp. WX]